ncbi:MAG: hypothetical protein KKA79_03775 [Nanoarchaeota archaeon]|nr:hypothetical protein [Nanoarchaeota archaeon]
MGKHKQHNNMQQLILEEYQDRPVTIIRVEAAALDTDPDMGTLPGCIGIHNQPEQGYECSTCYHQQLCMETTHANPFLSKGF